MNPTDEFLRRINGDRRTVPETHQRKPDPSEPWRYVCPGCGGQVNGQGKRHPSEYECGTCRDSWQKSELHDKKGDTDAK